MEEMKIDESDNQNEFEKFKVKLKITQPKETSRQATA